MYFSDVSVFYHVIIIYFQNVQFSMFIGYIYIYIYIYIQRVSNMVRQTSAVSFTHQNKENVVEICGQTHLVFEVQINNLLSHVVRPSGCYLWGT